MFLGQSWRPGSTRRGRPDSTATAAQPAHDLLPVMAEARIVCRPSIPLTLLA